MVFLGDSPFFFALTVERERDQLCISDLRKVRNTIWDARSQWYNVGIELDISVDTLDAISRNKRDDCGDCFSAMLTEWLRREQPKPTWNAVADALRSPSVNRRHLAEEIMSNKNI